jgi:Tfp pilus assembly protein PilF
MRTTLLLLTLCAGLRADWNASFTRGEELQRAGRYERALAAFEEALQESDGVKTPVTWNNLGAVCRALGRTREAEKYYRLAIRYYEKQEGLESSLATTLENLGALEVMQGQLAKAEAHQRQAYEIRLRVQGANDPAIAHSLLGLAETEQERQHAGQAEANYRQAMSIYASAFGTGSLKLAPVLHNLATLLAENGRVEEARAAFERALAIYRESAPKHPDQAIVLRHLAELNARAGNKAEADAEFGQAVALCEEGLPVGHPQTGTILQAYGMFLKKNGQGREAAALLARAGRILSKDARESGAIWVVEASALTRN